MGFFSHLLTPNQDRFARMLTKALERQGRGPFTYDPAEFALREGTEGAIYLVNVFSSYRTESRLHRVQAFDRIVRGFSEMDTTPTSWEAARDKLLPVVRSPYYYEEARRLATERDPAAKYPRVRRRLAELLAADLVIDSSDSMAMVDDDTLKRWGKPFDELLTIAIDNLRRKHEVPFAPLGPGLFTGAWNDSYDSARILTPEILHQLPFKGDPVVMIPDRDMLLVTGDREEAAIATMVNLVKDKLLERSRRISFQLFRHDGSGWSLFEPVGPVRLASTYLKVAELSVEYETQKAWLEKKLEHEGTDVFVSTYRPIQKEGAEATSYTAWTKTVDTLLPKTERVILVVLDEAGKEAVATVDVAWATLQELLPELRTPVPDLFPPRFRVNSFPDDATLARLKNLKT